MNVVIGIILLAICGYGISKLIETNKIDNNLDD